MNDTNLAAFGTLIQETHPGELAQALANKTQMIPGSALLLRAGTYSGDYVCILEGSKDNPIIISAYPGERVIIDGSFRFSGNYITLENVELMYSGWTTRQSQEHTSSPSDMPIGKQVVVSDTISGITTPRCIIHDLMQGILAATSASDMTVTESLVYYCGWNDLTFGSSYGHGIYTGNESGYKLFKNNILFDQFGLSYHLYAQSGSINDVTVESNIVFESGALSGHTHANILVGGSVPCLRPVIKNNLTWRSAYQPNNVGYSYGAQDVSLINNRCPEGFQWIPSTTFINDSGNDFTVPTGNEVFVQALDGRAHIAIYNGAEAATVHADVSGVFQPGDVLKCHNCQDYFADIQTLTVDQNGQITIGMTGRSVAQPIAWPAPASTFPIFGAFVVEK